MDLPHLSEAVDLLVQLEERMVVWKGGGGGGGVECVSWSEEEIEELTDAIDPKEVIHVGTILADRDRMEEVVEILLPTLKLRTAFSCIAGNSL